MLLIAHFLNINPILLQAKEEAAKGPGAVGACSWHECQVSFTLPPLGFPWPFIAPIKKP